MSFIFTNSHLHLIFIMLSRSNRLPLFIALYFISFVAAGCRKDEDCAFRPCHHVSCEYPSGREIAGFCKYVSLGSNCSPQETTPRCPLSRFGWLAECGASTPKDGCPNWPAQYQHAMLCDVHWYTWLSKGDDSSGGKHRGNAWLNLVHNWIVTKLNIAKGVPPTSTHTAAVTKAEGMLANSCKNRKLPVSDASFITKTLSTMGTNNCVRDVSVAAVQTVDRRDESKKDKKVEDHTPVTIPLWITTGAVLFLVAMVIIGAVYYCCSKRNFHSFHRHQHHHHHSHPRSNSCTCSDCIGVQIT